MALDLRGVITPIVTPFNPDESIDESGFRTLLDYFIAHGVNGLFICGGQGEGVSLSPGEKNRLLDIALETVNGRVPVLMGTGAITTRSTIEQTRAAESAGADVATIITPYYITPTQEELFRHYRDILDSVDIPVLIYNNHWRTHINILPETVARLSEYAPHLVGIKDSSGDLAMTIKFKALSRDGFRVFIGRDQLIYAGLCSGIDGTVAATSNAAIDLVVGIYREFSAGNLMAAQDYQRRLTPLRDFFSEGTFPVITKEAMQILGLPSGPCRRPVGPLSEEKRTRLKTLLADIGLM